MFENALAGIAQKAERTNPQKPDDYIKDGLLYCGKCHTPKQAMIRQPRVKGFEQGYKPMPIICECREKEIEDERKAQEAYQRKLYRYRVLGKVAASHTFEADDRAEDFASKVCYGYSTAFKEITPDGIKQTPKDGLLLCGGTGTGKTFLCQAILNAVADKGYTIMSVTAGQFERKVWGGDKAEIFESIERVDLLLLDDLGAERASQYTQQLIFDLVDTRLGARKPMLITSNLTQEQLTNPDTTDSKRILSRIMGSVSIVPLLGKDRRVKEFAVQAQERTAKYHQMGEDMDKRYGVPF